MGVLPLQFEPGQDRATLGLTGEETYDIEGLASVTPGQRLTVRATSPPTARGDGGQKSFTVLCRIDTPVEQDYYAHGGILPFVLRQLLA
jgi:aconitate hydratase